MKKILVLTDFSECAGQASRAAIEIAKKSGSSIHFLHCKAVPFNWVYLTDVENQIYKDVSKEIKNVNSKLEEWVKQANEEGIEAHHSVCYNEDNYAVVEYINEHDVDFVLMGSHGARGFKEAFIGSNAQKVVRYSDVPVFVVKKEMKSLDNPRVVFISDFESEIIGAFNKVLDFAKTVGAKIDLLYINTPTYFSETWEMNSRMQMFIDHAASYLGNVEMINSTNFERGIESYCFQKDNVILAMATHGRTGIARMLVSSLTEKVINHIDRPVLSLHI